MTLARGAIVLIGMRGAGKSSVGRALASLLELPFVDLDERIEAAAGRSIRSLFAAEGEAAFRARELAALRSLPGTRLVLAAGGGIVETAAARRELRRAGTRIWLQADARVIADRLARGRGRPRMHRGSWIDEVRALASRRGAWYREVANIVVRAGRRGVNGIAEGVARRVVGG